MSFKDGLIKDRVRFLGQEPEKLRGVRGHELYDTLNGLGLTHGHYFRALGTTAQEYCAQEFGVDVNRITVERFFQSDPNAKWLFPDIVREAVVSGLNRKPVYSQLIAGDEHINSTAYEVPVVTESEDEEELRTVAEGAAIPESEITYGSRIVRLDKKGRGVIASYEVIRRMSLNVLKVHLQRIGERLGRSLDKRIVDVLVSGDNSGSTGDPVTVDTITADTWTYKDLTSGFLALSLQQYFTPTHVLVSPATASALINLPEFKDSYLFNFAKTGELASPFGAKLIPMLDQPDDKITFLDSGYAVQKLTEQDLLVESDKLINQQWERTYLTAVTDFAILYANARVLLNSTWS